MSEAAISYEAWYELRDLVLDAVYTKKLVPSQRLKEKHATIVALVEEYLRTRNTARIDQAARVVARMCPGASVEAADSNPWLLLEKS
ncbi:MAG TPA: hypothetical protein PLE80_06930 [Opitutaceae bacterium]|nr:hypothetical protein [Opitutaceae bacterium]